MLIQRLQPPLQAAVSSSIARSGTGMNGGVQGNVCLHELFAALNLSTRAPARRPFVNTTVRHASHKAQGAVNKAKDGPGKRLGAKKSGEQYVIPGNIIFRQRGTHWFPGENCAMGRDHTIYATEPGYVKYYRDPAKHPKRQYIGVVFDRDDSLPYPRTQPRKRRLGMVAVKMEPAVPTLEEALAAEEEVPKLKRGKYGLFPVKKNLTLRPNGYMYRESNWEIGRMAERAGVRVRKFKPGDRWLAWRRRALRKKRIDLKKALSRRTAKPKKKKNRE